MAFSRYGMRRSQFGGISPNTVHAPRLGDRFEHSDHQAANLLTQVEVEFRVFDDRQIRVKPFDRFCDQVVVFSGLEGDIHPGHPTHLTGPDSAAVDHKFGFNFALGSDHAGDPPTVF
jgi:hypothetical protein